jgi:hypothetical protein
MRPTFLHVTLLAVFVLAAAGCATIQANITETAKWQGLADQATAALGSGPVTVLLKGSTRTGSSSSGMGPERSGSCPTRWKPSVINS